MIFNITQSPCRPSGTAAVDLTVSIQGALLIINGESFDFAFMEKGSTLPRAAVDSPHFCSDVVCDDSGAINLTLLVPVGPAPSETEAFPTMLSKQTEGTVIDIHLPAIELPTSPAAPSTSK